MIISAGLLRGRGWISCISVRRTLPAGADSNDLRSEQSDDQTGIYGKTASCPDRKGTR